MRRRLYLVFPLAVQSSKITVISIDVNTEKKRLGNQRRKVLLLFMSGVFTQQTAIPYINSPDWITTPLPVCLLKWKYPNDTFDRVWVGIDEQQCVRVGRIWISLLNLSVSVPRRHGGAQWIPASVTPGDGNTAGVKELRGSSSKGSEGSTVGLCRAGGRPRPCRESSVVSWREASSSLGLVIERVGYRKPVPMWHRFQYNRCYPDRNATHIPVLPSGAWADWNWKKLLLWTSLVTPPCQQVTSLSLNSDRGGVAVCD